jgi:hypothetical protein
VYCNAADKVQVDPLLLIKNLACVSTSVKIFSLCSYPVKRRLLCSNMDCLSENEKAPEGSITPSGAHAGEL